MMNIRSLKLFLTICAIFGLCIALGVGQAQATLSVPINGIGDNYDVAFFNDLTTETIILLDKDEFNDGVAVGDVSDQWLTVTGYADDPLQEATVSWNLTGEGLEARYVAVKDGDTPEGTGVDYLFMLAKIS